MKPFKLIVVLLLALFIGGLSSTAFASKTIVVYNHSGDDIKALFVAPSSSDSWGKDRLIGILHAGNSLNVNLATSDRNWDVRAVFMSGKEAKWDKVDFSQYSSITIFYNSKTSSYWITKS